jgi:hypothetical protein
MDRICCSKGEEDKFITILVRKPEGKRKMCKPESNGRMILKWIIEKIWEGVE